MVQKKHLSTKALRNKGAAENFQVMFHTTKLKTQPQTSTIQFVNTTAAKLKQNHSLSRKHNYNSRCKHNQSCKLQNI